MTMGALSSPRATISLIASPNSARSPYPSRQTLKRHAAAGEADPAGERLLLRKQTQHELVRLADVVGIAGERHPPKRPAPLAKQRAHVRGDEAGEREGLGHPGAPCLRAN